LLIKYLGFQGELCLGVNNGAGGILEILPLNNMIEGIYWVVIIKIAG
jgi:hypothetical protein